MVSKMTDCKGAGGPPQQQGSAGRPRGTEQMGDVWAGHRAAWRLFLLWFWLGFSRFVLFFFFLFYFCELEAF